MRWKRALLLAPLLVGLFVVAVAEPDPRAIGIAIKDKIIAELKDPLRLYDERSPGRRGSVTLLLKKSKAGPRERVLPTIREREPAPGIPASFTPLLATPPEVPSFIPGPGDIPLPNNPFTDPPFFLPPLPLPFGSPDFIPEVPPTGPNPPIPPLLPPIPPPVTIPEPPTWMMVLGILAFGAGMRRHARQRHADFSGIR
ncbi:MAG TPA: hypothetical protein VJ750_09600 [Rhizomicrobium sp.]|nr:hypothetical protein [Rhizomicrobium sp.]